MSIVRDLPGKTKRATRSRVAREAGVSLATVTYALQPNGKLRMGDETRERIRRIARELGYRPGYVNRALVAGRTYTIALLVPEHKSLIFPFYEIMLTGMIGAMNAEDYDPLLVMRSDWARVEKVIRDGRVDGVIMIQSDLDDQPARSLAASGVPFVLVNRALPDGLAGRCACVYSDHLRMMREMVDEFVGMGCRSILNFCGSQTVFANLKAYDGFNAAIAAYAGEGVLGTSLPPQPDRFENLARSIFDNRRRWDGIFVDGRLTANTLVEEAERQGMIVGRDFEMITTDAYHDRYAQHHGTDPRRREISVYWQQPDEVGCSAWESMSALLNGKPGQREILVPYQREKLRSSSFVATT